MCVHCLQIKARNTVIVSKLLYLYQTEGDTNLSECHPCFMIPLLMTKPPSTSCLEVITKDIEKWINALSLHLSFLLCLSLSLPLYSKWVGPVWQTWRPWSVCHKLNYAYIRHMVSLAWEKWKHTHTRTPLSLSHTHTEIPQRKTCSPSKTSLNSMVFSLMPDVYISANSSQQPHYTSCIIPLPLCAVYYIM